MSATVYPFPSALEQQIGALRLEVGQLEELEAERHAAWQQTAGELEHALKELAELEAQEPPLPWCGTCTAWHRPVEGECPPPPGCADCEAGPGERCTPGCMSRVETEWGDAS